jgi:hypothetical protein
MVHIVALSLLLSPFQSSLLSLPLLMLLLLLLLLLLMVLVQLSLSLSSLSLSLQQQWVTWNEHGVIIDLVCKVAPTIHPMSSGS